MELQKFRVAIILSLLFFALNVTAQSSYDTAYDNLRTAVYNSTTSLESDIIRLYNTIIKSIKNDNSVESNIKFSQCDYLLAMFYSDDSQIEKAIDCFESSLNWAEKAIKLNPTSQGYLAYAESLAQICPLKSTSYLLANALKVPTIAKKAIKLDNRLGAARYLVCCTITYSPKPLRNFDKAEKRFKEILKNDNLDKEDCFNIYRSLGYIFYQQKKFSEADKWFDKAAKIYPDNKFLLSMQNREYTKDSFVDVEPVIDTILME